MIMGGLVAHPVSAAKDVLRLYRDLTVTASDDLMLFFGLLTGPDGATKLAAIVAGHIGSHAQAEADLRPLKQFGTPLMDAIGPMPYSVLNSMLDPSFPRGARNYWKAHFMDQLTDEAIDAMIEQFASCPSPMSAVMLEHFHGAAARVPVTDTAYALRKTGYNLVILSQWMDGADDGRGVTWARESYSALQPFTGPSRYLNYLDHDETADAALVAAYGPNLDRLRNIKGKYDPNNVFHHNVNIKPI
jgi:hypothetical protein